MIALSNIALTLLFATNSVQAKPQGTWERGLKTGGATTLSAIGGFALGWVIGDYSSNEESTNPITGSIIGASIAPPITAALMSDYVGSNKLIVGGATGAVSIVGLTCTISGFAAEQYDLAVVGGGLLVLGTGLTAGISAGLFPNPELQSFHPVITPQYRGLAFHTEF